MVLRRSAVLLSLIAFAATSAVMACASDGDLNPQPLPPLAPGDDDDTKDPPERTSTSGGGTSGTSGSYGTASSSGVGAAPIGDAGADADASQTP